MSFCLKIGGESANLAPTPRRRSGCLASDVVELRTLGCERDIRTPMQIDSVIH
jgi:hypothetical protein